MSDDSSEDIPLSALGKKAQIDDSDEAEFDMDHEDGSDDVIVEDDDGDHDDKDGDYVSDSSDDAPLSSLRSPPKKKAAVPPPSNVKPASKTAKKDAPKKKSTKTKSTPKPKKTTNPSKAASTSSFASSSNYLCASSELYSQCDKGRLIQSLLARWWYAYQWPDPKTLLTVSTPGGYDALDGFPGVYICTQGSNVGKFMDKRDHERAPSFKNFANKNSEELKDMLLRAIEGQMKDLIKHEGNGTDTERELKVLEKWAARLNTSKADEEAKKVLKAKKLTLP